MFICLLKIIFLSQDFILIHRHGPGTVLDSEGAKGLLTTVACSTAAKHERISDFQAFLLKSSCSELMQRVTNPLSDFVFAKTTAFAKLEETNLNMYLLCF